MGRFTPSTGLTRSSVTFSGYVTSIAIVAPYGPTNLLPPVSSVAAQSCLRFCFQVMAAAVYNPKYAARPRKSKTAVVEEAGSLGDLDAAVVRSLIDGELEGEVLEGALR